MDYSADVDLDAQWEDMYEQASNHLESLLADLVGYLPRSLSTNDWYAFDRDLERVTAIAQMLKEGDMMGYGDRFIGDLSWNGED